MALRRENLELRSKAGLALVCEIRENNCEKCKVYSGVFHVTFFAFCISCQGRRLCRKSKDFVVYFFEALIKHEIRMKYEKCIGSVSYFVVRFENTCEIPVKCEIRKVYS